MEYIKQSSDEVDIRGPESKYDSRKINSYPSKVGTLPFFQYLSLHRVCCTAVRAATHPPPPPPSQTSSAPLQSRLRPAYHHITARIYFCANDAKQQATLGCVWQCTPIPQRRAFRAANGLCGRANIVQNYCHWTWCLCTYGCASRQPCTCGSNPRRGFCTVHQGARTTAIQARIAMKCDPYRCVFACFKNKNYIRHGSGCG